MPLATHQNFLLGKARKLYRPKRKKGRTEPSSFERRPVAPPRNLTQKALSRFTARPRVNARLVKFVFVFISSIRLG